MLSIRIDADLRATLFLEKPGYTFTCLTEPDAVKLYWPRKIAQIDFAKRVLRRPVQKVVETLRIKANAP
jgi:hypothetical protein